MSIAAATTAFVAGVLSFLSPCVLPLIPAYLAYMSGAEVGDLMAAQGFQSFKRTGLKSILFVLGFTIVFVAMGAAATSVGQLLQSKIEILSKIAGVIIVIFGLHMLGVFRIKALYSEKRFHLRMENLGLWGSFLIGITFALGWTPCIGPVLAGILTLAAQSNTVVRGMVLLALYSLGLGIPFLLAGFATGAVLRVLSGFKKYFRSVEIASGTLMILVGVLIFNGNLENTFRRLLSILHPTG
jgi:cytochrome c-type biogenesis protein